MRDNGKFVFWFEGENDVGQFSATVAANGFTGETGYVVSLQQVREFLRNLSVFPISNVVTLVIGEEFSDGPLLLLAVEPADKLGNLRVRVHLAADDNRSRIVSTDFRCVYSSVERFVREVEGVLQSGGSAILRAD